MLRVYLVFGKIMKLLWQILNAIRLIFLAVNEQILVTLATINISLRLSDLLQTFSVLQHSCK